MTKKAKPAAKRKANKAPIKKAVIKKKAAVKKKKPIATKTVAKKKPVTPARKPTIRTIKNTGPKKPAATHPKERVETNLPPVEEKSPEINNDTITPVQTTVTKSAQKSAVRQYDNHNIRLSGKKGGLKPSGKKPLW
jgi:hypothetical protein